MKKWNELKDSLREKFGKDSIIRFYNDTRKGYRRIKVCVLTTDLNKMFKFCKDKGYDVMKWNNYQFVITIKE